MATTDWDWQSTRSSIIERAFRIVGALKPGQSLSGEKSTQGVQVLNDMVKSWQADKVYLWTLKQLTITPVASDKDYAAPTDPTIKGIDEAFWKENSTEIPISVITWRKYQQIYNKDHEANRVLYMALQPGQTPTIYVWPVPNTSAAATGTIEYLGVSTLKDWDSNSSTGDFPVHWTNALVYSLADDLFDEYGGSNVDRKIITTKAKEYVAKARSGDADYADGGALIDSAYPNREDYFRNRYHS